MIDHPKTVAILIFDDVEILDFCGPYEVFGVAGRDWQPQPFQVYTVARELKPILARNQLSINPQYSIFDCPPVDILLIPGGYGTRLLLNDPIILQWIQEQSQDVEYLLSVCTGALVLAKAGLLENLAATTHHLAFDLLRKLAPNTEIRENQRLVDNGKIILSGGISAGIDMSLYVVGKLLGIEEAWKTAAYMEYDTKVF